MTSMTVNGICRWMRLVPIRRFELVISRADRRENLDEDERNVFHYISLESADDCGHDLDRTGHCVISI